MASALAVVLTIVASGCSRPTQGMAEPTPTYIAQPTPNPTIAAVLQGQGPQVAYLPPMEIKGSPTPIPVARPGSSGAAGSRPTPKPATTQRDAPPPREAAPKPAPTSAPARSAPTAPPRANSTGAGTTQTGPGAAPAIINPNTALPGGPVRPNPTPGR